MIRSAGINNCEVTSLGVCALGACDGRATCIADNSARVIVLHSPVPPVWIRIGLSSWAKYTAAPVSLPLGPSCDEPSV